VATSLDSWILNNRDPKDKNGWLMSNQGKSHAHRINESEKVPQKVVGLKVEEYRDGVKGQPLHMSSENLLNQIFETTADGICVIDREFTVLCINETLKDRFGIPEASLIGKKCYDVIPSSLCRISVCTRCHTQACPMIRIAEGVKRLEYKVDRPSKDGAEVPCILIATPFRKPNGELSGIIENFRDISEIEQAREKLQLNFEKLQKTMEEVIQAIALVVEARDPYTAGHQQRMADLARAISRELGMLEEDIEGIRMAGLIHDLGKIKVPAEILSKPGKLNKNEFAFLRDHPQSGYDILKGIDFPWPVAQIVFEHHENMDGSGYPQGLKGDQILKEARILRVADVVEAMSSHRPYRPALGPKEVLREISLNRGFLYDPAVVDAWLRLRVKK
jgi:PAS domain S-box-containing protein/putative nucleotidyltransferase with HDIG domain